MFDKKNEETPQKEELKPQFLKRMYKITVETIHIYNQPETDYQIVGKDEQGKSKYDYIKTGKMVEEEKNVKKVYEQKLDDLDVREMALWINRVR